MVIFISGSINSGKSTVSKLLQSHLGEAALVEIDALRDFVSWMPIDQAVQLNLKNAVSVINNFCSEGIDVIVPYPLSEKNYQYLLENLTDVDSEIVVVSLVPRLEIALQNRGGRELDDWERERIKHHYQIGISNPSFGVVIDNSDQQPQETVQLILDLISKATPPSSSAPHAPGSPR